MMLYHTTASLYIVLQLMKGDASGCISVDEAGRSVQYHHLVTSPKTLLGSAPWPLLPEFLLQTHQQRNVMSSV